MGRSPGEGNGYPLQYSGLENSMDYIVHGVAKSQTQLSGFHFHLFLKHSYTNNKFTPQSQTMGLILCQCPSGCKKRVLSSITWFMIQTLHLTSSKSCFTEVTYSLSRAMQTDFILLKFPPFSFKQFSLDLVCN